MSNPQLQGCVALQHTGGLLIPSGKAWAGIKPRRQKQWGSPNRKEIMVQRTYPIDIPDGSEGVVGGKGTITQ